MILYLLIFPLLCYLAALPFRSVLKLDQTKHSYSIIVGLLLFLFANLILKLVGLNWSLTLTITHLCIINYGLFHLYVNRQQNPIQAFLLSVKQDVVSRVKGASRLSMATQIISFLLFCSLIIFLSSRIYFFDDGHIKTTWINNYGDLAFHIGMITSFVFGDNFPPEYHIFPGALLTYPYLVNFWTACLWAWTPDFQTLEYIFIFQWIFVWLIAYFLLDSKLRFLILLCILFAGGSYFEWQTVRAPQGIPDGYLWLSLIDTIWTTQRSAMFGLLLTIAIAQLVLPICKFEQPENLKLNLPLTAILLMGLPVIHTFFWMVTFGFILALALHYLFFLRSPRIFLKLILCILPSISWSLFFANKTGVLSFEPNGVFAKFYESEKLLTTIFNNLIFILQNIQATFILFILFLVYLIYESWQKQKFQTLIFFLGFFLVSFLMFNYLRMASWVFDQFKFFIAMYILFVLFWAQTIRSSHVINVALFLLMIPGAYRGFYVNFIQPKLNKQPVREYVVYHRNQIEEAKLIREITKPTDIIVGSSQHNSTITLTGRRLFYGYEGTLWTHQLRLHERRIEQREFLKTGKHSYLDYVYWNTHMRKKFKINQLDPKSFEKINNFMYRKRFRDA